MKKSRGNLLVTFMILVALSVAILMYLNLTFTKMEDTTVSQADSQAFFVAEAGLNKAIWYLSTSTGSGGKGLSWRTTGTTESFGAGSYNISVQTVSASIISVVSTGDVRGSYKSVAEQVSAGGVPAAFTYAVYSNDTLQTQNAVNISGDVWANGNITLSSGTVSTNGKIYHPLGTTISGAGATYTDGGVPTSIPPVPSFDNSYYKGLIATAVATSTAGVSYAGGTWNLNGQTLYYNSDVMINAATTLNGPGNIVSAGGITIQGSTTTTGTIEFVAGKGLTFNSDCKGSTGVMFYASGEVIAQNSIRVDCEKGLVAMGGLTATGSVTLNGLVFVQGDITVQSNPVIQGCLCTANPSLNNLLSGPLTVTYNPLDIPVIMPPGVGGGQALGRKKGTWMSW